MHFCEASKVCYGQLTASSMSNQGCSKGKQATAPAPGPVTITSSFFNAHRVAAPTIPWLPRCRNAQSRPAVLVDHAYVRACDTLWHILRVVASESSPWWLVSAGRCELDVLRVWTRLWLRGGQAGEDLGWQSWTVMRCPLCPTNMLLADQGSVFYTFYQCIISSWALAVLLVKMLTPRLIVMMMRNRLRLGGSTLPILPLTDCRSRRLEAGSLAARRAKSSHAGPFRVM